MVLKRIANATSIDKMESKWEGPYIITRMIRVGAYNIATVDGDLVKHIWNAKSLRGFYP